MEEMWNGWFSKFEGMKLKGSANFDRKFLYNGQFRFNFLSVIVRIVVKFLAIIPIYEV